jgi:biopolymer transport protein ExbD
MAISVSPERTETMSEINITPFTDVLLVLLIVFMVLAALATPPGFQKRLPGTCRCEGDDHGKRIEVKVTASNAISIDAEPIKPGQLYVAMAAAISYHQAHKQQGYSAHVWLLADQNANYDTIIKILDAARQAGDDDVGILTD